MNLSKIDIMDFSRMLPWLLFSFVFYFMALHVEQFQMQTLFWKLGHINIGAHLGYWIARRTLGRIYLESPTNDRIARAIVVGAVILAISLGL